MRQTLVGSCIGLLLSVASCTGAGEGDVPADTVEVKSQLETALVAGDVSASAAMKSQIDTGLVGSDFSKTVSADISAEITNAQSFFQDLALNPAGIAATFHLSGGIDRTNPFF